MSNDININKNTKLETNVIEKNDKSINTNMNELIPYKTTILTNKRAHVYHDICMVINYMIISGTLLILTYFLYNLTREMKKIDVVNLTNGITSINDNLYSISNFGNKLNNHIETIETFTSDNLDANKVKELIFDINQTLFRLNNFMIDLKNYRPLEGITSYQYDILPTNQDTSSITSLPESAVESTSETAPTTVKPEPQATSIPPISNNKPF